MNEPDRRLAVPIDRRRVPRGGRRETDLPGRHPAVLVADQYEDARSPIARYLDRYGFQVMEASSGAAASELVARHRPHVILSGLRGDDASSFYASLPSPELRPPIVIVLLSGTDDPIPPNATAVLAKPFSLRPMLDRLRRALHAAAAEPLGLA